MGDLIYVFNGTVFYSVNLADGTKVRAKLYNSDSENTVCYPESLDLKITNYCEANCPWCHENSTVKGKHADYKWLSQFIDSIPPGTELAIGGGDVLTYPHLKDMLKRMRARFLIPSITVNIKTLRNNSESLKEILQYIYGLGISIDSPNQLKSESHLQPYFRYKNTVFHVIAGLWNEEDLLKLSSLYQEAFGALPKVLILGYKNFGRGKLYLDTKANQIAKNIKELQKALQKKEFRNKFKVIALDNLAVDQLSPQNMFNNNFSSVFLGEDGVYTMYIDAVNQVAGISSYSDDRYSIEPDIKTAFAKVKLAKLDKNRFSG